MEFANPYCPGTSEYLDWLDGWHLAAGQYHLDHLMKGQTAISIGEAHDKQRTRVVATTHNF